jgi:hypothetical protein
MLQAIIMNGSLFASGNDSSNFSNLKVKSTCEFFN